MDVTYCGQQNCTRQIAWGITVREPDGQGGMKGGRKMPVDWPFPDPIVGDPAANLGVRQDVHGSLIVRVLTAREPIRADERPAVPHWATCANPPGKGARPSKSRQLEAPQPGDALFDDTPLRAQTPAHDKVRDMLSNSNLFPRRKRG